MPPAGAVPTLALVSAAFEVSADDPVGLADAVRRAAAGEVVQVVRDGELVAHLVPPRAPVASGGSSPSSTARPPSSPQPSPMPSAAAAPVMRGLPLDAARASDPCELDAAAMAELEARMASRPAAELRASRFHAERFGAPTLAHYRAVYLQAGAPWPGEGFVRRHHPVADPEIRTAAAAVYPVVDR